jgi:hypothetical protein
MEPTDVSPRPAATGTPQNPPIPVDATVITLPPRTEDVVNLFKRFRHEWDNMPGRKLSRPTPPRFKVFDELSFSELFRLNALWHRVKRPRPPNGADANARHARLQERQWENFYYDWAQPCLQERWTQRYGLVQAGGYLSYRRLLGKHSRVGYRDYRREDDYPPCCDHTTLWRREGTPPRFAEVLVTQPYSYDLDEMVAFAKDQGFWFWISERPAWHYPRGVFFIVGPSRKPVRLAAGKTRSRRMDEDNSRVEGRRDHPRPGRVFLMTHPIAEAVRRGCALAKPRPIGPQPDCTSSAPFSH